MLVLCSVISPASQRSFTLFRSRRNGTAGIHYSTVYSQRARRRPCSPSVPLFLFLIMHCYGVIYSVIYISSFSSCSLPVTRSRNRFAAAAHKRGNGKINFSHFIVRERRRNSLFGDSFKVVILLLCKYLQSRESLFLIEFAFLDEQISGNCVPRLGTQQVYHRRCQKFTLP